MPFRPVILMLGLACLLAVTVTVGASGQSTDQQAEAASDDQTAKQQALGWIDSFASVQVLFHEQDVDRLRERLAEATPEQAQQWLEKTTEIRKALDSPRWRETRQWLKEFLRVQAIYSDEQVAHFRTEVQIAAKTSPAKFEEILLDVEKKRLELDRGAANSALLRQRKVELAQAYRKEQAAARDAARLAAAQSPPQAPTQPAAPRREYRRRPPLVDSLDVARWSIMREFWPRW